MGVFPHKLVVTEAGLLPGPPQLQLGVVPIGPLTGQTQG